MSKTNKDKDRDKEKQERNPRDPYKEERHKVHGILSRIKSPEDAIQYEDNLDEYYKDRNRRKL